MKLAIVIFLMICTAIGATDMKIKVMKIDKDSIKYEVTNRTKDDFKGQVVIYTLTREGATATLTHVHTQRGVVCAARKKDTQTNGGVVKGSGRIVGVLLVLQDEQGSLLASCHYRLPKVYAESQTQFEGGLFAVGSEFTKGKCTKLVKKEDE